MAVLLDIEGTICPITFVKDVLYPYFTNKLPSVLNSVSFPLDPHSDDAVTQILSGLPTETQTDASTVKAHFDDLVRQDIKDPILKALQGFVWQSGYQSGEITAPVYPDAIEYIKTTTDDVYIYSLGSIKAQKLLFSYVDDAGTAVDLNSYLKGYYDIPTAGYKNQPSSYTKIAEDIGLPPSQILFLSDNELEVKAATEAGMKAKIMVRPGNFALLDIGANYDQVHLMAEAVQTHN